MSRLTLALAAQAITCVVGVLGSVYVVGISVFNHLLFFSIFAPIPIGLYYAIWNKHRRKTLILTGFLIVAAGLVAARFTSSALYDVAKRRGDLILTALEQHQSREGRPALRLAELVPNYMEKIPPSPFVFSHYSLIDTNKIQFDAPAFMQCRKAVGGDWECDD